MFSALLFHKRTSCHLYQSSDFSFNFPSHFRNTPCLPSYLTLSHPLFFLSFHFHSSFLPTWQHSWISLSLSLARWHITVSSLYAATPQLSVSSSDLVRCVMRRGKVWVCTSSRLWLWLPWEKTKLVYDDLIQSPNKKETTEYMVYLLCCLVGNMTSPAFLLVLHQDRSLRLNWSSFNFLCVIECPP